MYKNHYLGPITPPLLLFVEECVDGCSLDYDDFRAVLSPPDFSIAELLLFSVYRNKLLLLATANVFSFGCHVLTCILSEISLETTGALFFLSG